MKAKLKVLKKTVDTFGVVLFFIAIAIFGGITGALVVQFLNEVTR